MVFIFIFSIILFTKTQKYLFCVFVPIFIRIMNKNILINIACKKIKLSVPKNGLVLKSKIGISVLKPYFLTSLSSNLAANFLEKLYIQNLNSKGIFASFPSINAFSLCIYILNFENLFKYFKYIHNLYEKNMREPNFEP